VNLQNARCNDKNKKIIISVCPVNHKKHQVGKIYDFSRLEQVAHRPRPIITTVEEVKFRDIFTFTFIEENNSRFHAGEV
jgi:hypothetical protein